MSERRRLRNRRGSTTFAIESQALAFTVTVSAFDSGELAEIFITNHRANSGAGIMASDCAIAASLALQFGCPADVLRKAATVAAAPTARSGPRSTRSWTRNDELRHISGKPRAALAAKPARK
jgi:hypothetical protein